MAISTRSLKCILYLIFCLIINPTVISPAEDSSSADTAGVSGVHFPDIEAPSGNEWTYGFPYFPKNQDGLLETKRLSAFFPSRGKKDGPGISPNSEEFPFNDQTVNIPRATPPSIQWRGGFYGILPKLAGFEELRNGLEEDTNGSPLLTEPQKWSQLEKRRSAFMPMRGRKRYMMGSDPLFLEGYSSHLSGGPLDEYRKMFSAQDKKQTDSYGKMIHPDSAPIRDHVGKLTESRKESLSVEELENTTALQGRYPFPGGRIIAIKRALSFIPTRGRRGGHNRDFVPKVNRVAGWQEDVVPVRTLTNLAQDEEETQKEGRQRNRRASTFMPMRGRKSIASPYWVPNKYFPRTRGHEVTFGEIEIGKQLPQADRMEDLPENFRYVDEPRQKTMFDTDGLQQKLRTAVVMKRPVSFFAARGKRMEGDGLYAR